MTTNWILDFRGHSDNFATEAEAMTAYYGMVARMPMGTAKLIAVTSPDGSRWI